MSKRKIFDFLRDLRENNSKEWMDENRERYHEAKQIWLEEVGLFLERLAKQSPALGKIRPRDTIMRINNNNVFHPDKPTYKDSFGFDPDKGREKASFYLHCSPSGSFIAGGVYHPGSEALKKLRSAIDYDGEKFKKIIRKKEFTNFFGGLYTEDELLKTSPRDYSADHPHIDLLRRKSITVVHNLTQEEMISDDLVDTVEEAYRVMRPFNQYLERALGFEG